MKKKVIIIVVLTLAALAAIVMILQNNKKKNQQETAVVAEGNEGAVAVRTAVANKTDLEIDFTANGTFAANQDLVLSAESSGRVKFINVDEGSRVSKGQVLARIDNELLTVDAQTAKANYENALRDLERYESSFKTGGITKQQLDNARLRVRTSLASVQSTGRRSSDANVRAPFSGIVNKRFIEKGSYVNPGAQLFEIVDLSKLKLKVTVGEAQVVNLRKGDRVAIKSTVFPDQSFSGKVSFIAAKADNSLNFPVEIEVTNTAGDKLKAGMYGTAVFQFPNSAPAITVPRSAFVGSVNSNKIYVLEGDVARQRSVTAGRILGDTVEILGGLEEGETVIVSGQVNLVDGSKVKAVK